jgi:hypothetical protein
MPSLRSPPSRSRLMAAVTTEWQRVARNLHDGAQQQFVAVGMRLRSLQHQLGPRQPAYGEIDRAVDMLEGAVADQSCLSWRWQKSLVLELGNGKRRPCRVSVTTSLATGTPATRPASCFAPRGRFRPEGGWCRHLIP